jgi:ATPase subunit of ABC transporter with duplicated ATPase domains
MISVENLSKSYGGQVLFDKAGFKLNARERAGLVGRNGHGKTSLLRLIRGEESPDGGNITRPKNYRIGHVEQTIRFSRDSALEEGMTGLPAAERDHHWKIEKILAGLGFSGRDMQRHPTEFSGGYQVRLNLAKHLVSEPDLLLLDEPTNYLDITSIRWVERFLLSWPHEVLLITHDRSFMDNIVTHTMGIHRRKVRKIEGNTEKYYAQIAQDEEVHEKTRINDDRRRREIELFITRFRAKARLANLVQSRIKTLAKLEQQEKLEKIESLGFSFRSKPFPAKQVMRVSDFHFGYAPEKPLIRKFNLTVAARDRICVVGKNGKGKTTLLKLLAGALRPQSGQIRYNPNVASGLFEQTNIKSLVDDRTVEEEIAYSNPQIDRQATRNICGAMMFTRATTPEKNQRPVRRRKEPGDAGQTAGHAVQPASAGRAHQSPGHGGLRCAAGRHRRFRWNGDHGHPQRNVPPRPGPAADRFSAGSNRNLRRQLRTISWTRAAGRSEAVPSRLDRCGPVRPTSSRSGRRCRRKKLRRLRSQIIAAKAAVQWGRSKKRMGRASKSGSKKRRQRSNEAEQPTCRPPPRDRDGPAHRRLCPAGHPRRPGYQVDKLYEELEACTLKIEKNERSFDNKLARLEENGGSQE